MRVARAAWGIHPPVLRAQVGEPERCPRNSRPASDGGRGFLRVRKRACEQLLRRKRHLHGGRHVSRDVWLNDREQPALVLHPSGNADRAQPIIAAHPHIRQRAPAGNELLANLLVTEIQLNPVAWTEPVVAPGLRALALPTDPTSQQNAVIRKSV